MALCLGCRCCCLKLDGADGKSMKSAMQRSPKHDDCKASRPGFNPEPSDMPELYCSRIQKCVNASASFKDLARCEL